MSGVSFQFSNSELLNNIEPKDPAPPTQTYSVVSRTASTFACICCRLSAFGCYKYVECGALRSYSITYTRARWIWGFNVVCLLAHTFMATLCLTACDDQCTPENFQVKIYRMSSNWTDASADGFMMRLKDNGQPVRFDLLAAWFHILSAIAHGLAVLVGPFTRLEFLYWKQIDQAFCYWRWIEYSASAPLMFFCLQLSIGMREQITLAMSWMLMFITMICGLATEMWSRPAERDPDGYRGWVGDPKRTDVVRAIQKKLTNIRVNKTMDAPMYNEFASKLDAYDLQNAQILPPETGNQPTLLNAKEREIMRRYNADYRANYFFRMLPHIFGWFPYVTCWTAYFLHFIGQLNDLRQENEALFDRVPEFVPYAVVGTALWFTSFTFVQFYYQYKSPDEYWKTELFYSFLSLGSKLFLGLLLYVNVLSYASFDEAFADTPANRASR